MAQEAKLYRDDVEQVRRRWAEWRSTHAVRSRLPEALWAAAVELVQRDGIDATARALDVDKPSLRKWAGRLHPARHNQVGESPGANKELLSCRHSWNCSLRVLAWRRVVRWKWNRREAPSCGGLTF